MSMNQQVSPLSDQERMEDLIAEEKYMMNTYASFLPEATCPQLRQVLQTNFSDCAANQQCVYDEMSRKGWYPVKNASVPDVDAACQKFSQMKSQINL